MDIRKYIEENITISTLREGSRGGQQVGLTHYALQGELPDDGIKIYLSARRSQHKTKGLIIDLMEYALTERR
jgi:protein subunit release factor A